MKLLSVAIPCYNSAAYMSKAIESLLVGGEDIEIIIVNDGSTDDTEDIAKSYEFKYPNRIKSISKENGGHGSAVNVGLDHATGLYYKVVDSDDWLEEDALLKLLRHIKSILENGHTVDLFLANYVYERVSLNKRKVMDFKTALPIERIFTWDDIKFFKQSQYLIMHAAIYRTKLLKDCGLKLPHHTFYVDNIFVYQPLPYVKNMYYLDVDLYRYFIGREDQSVNEKNMIKRIDQQIKITKIMIDSHDLFKIKNKKLRNYMVKYLTMMMAIASIYLMKENTDISLAKKNELWNYLETSNKRLYKEIKSRFLGKSMNVKGNLGKKIVSTGYSIIRKIYGFN